MVNSKPKVPSFMNLKFSRKINYWVSKTYSQNKFKVTLYFQKKKSYRAIKRTTIFIHHHFLKSHGDFIFTALFLNSACSCLCHSSVYMFYEGNFGVKTRVKTPFLRGSLAGLVGYIRSWPMGDASFRYGEYT